jgi:hypothetical protein
MCGIGMIRCGDPVSSTVGTLRLRITDQAFPYAFVRSVRMHITRVAVRSAASQRVHVIESTPQTFDLISLQNGLTDTLGVASLPATSYDAVRLTISEVVVELTDGRSLSAAWSDSTSTEEVLILLASPITLRGNQLGDVVVDFDLPRSLTAEGDPASVTGITGFLFTPAARAADLATVGQITGLVRHNNGTPSNLSDDISVIGLHISIVQPGTADTVSVITDPQGEYVAFFIPAGVYTLAIGSTDSTAAWLINGVVVTTANPTRQDVLMPKQ